MKKINLFIFSLFLFPVAVFCQSGYTVCKGHTNLVCGVAYSPDGKKMASAGSWDNMVKIWNPVTGEELSSLNDFQEAQMSCVFAKNGNWLITAGNSGTISIFQAPDWTLLKTYTIPTGKEAWNIDISPNGQKLAIGCWDNNVYILDLNTFSVDKLTGHTAAVSGVAFSPDGKYVASASDDYSAIIWDIKTKKKKKTLTSHKAAVSIVDYSSDGKFLITGGDDKQVIVWNAKSGKEIKHVWMKDLVRAAAYSPNGKYFAAGGAGTDPNIYIFDAKTNAQLAKLEYHTSYINSLSFSPDSQWLVSGSSDNDVVVWNYLPYIR